MNKIVLTFVSLLISAALFAQTKVTGTVLDELGEPAIGASITVEGTTLGTVSDFDGYFELVVPDGTKTIKVSYVGYREQNVAVKPNVKVTLQQDTQQIQEVVVQGMVKQDKRLFTGAATKVDADKAKLDGVADISRSLAGRAAGVSVQNVSGTFGTAPKIRVRGATSIYGASKPLWVVDGVVLEDVVELNASDLSSGDATTLIASAIAGINADDIESFQILKDGSATSIYGARAMAGVIVVTTKKGKAGQSKFTYNSELTYRLIPSYMDYDVCNSQEQMGIYQELERKGWLDYSSLVSAKNFGIYGRMYQLIDAGKLENTQIAKNAYLREAEYRNTDWFKALFNQTIMHNHSLSFSAGTEKGRVYASLSAMHDPGWTKSDQVLRFTANLNASYDILKNLTATLIANASYRKQKAPGTTKAQTNPITGEFSREFDINPFSYALNTSRVMDPKDTYRRNYCDFNELDEMSKNYIDINVLDTKFQGELSYKPVRGLEISALGAIRYYSSSREHNIMDESNQARAYRAGIDPENSTIRDANRYLYTNPDDTRALPISILPKGGIYDLNEDKLISTDFRGTVSYNADLGKNGDHILSLFGGVEGNITDRQYIWFRGWGYQYNNGGVPYTDYRLFKQSQEENSQYYSNEFTYYRNLAFFAMGTYSYKGRYTINGTIRYEGTNTLGRSRNARWLPTWNVSGAWNAHEERWWQPTFGDAWTHASLKASYSLTADRGPASNSMVVFESFSPFRPSTDASETGIQLSALANDELTYEKKHELNIGAAFGFVDNRINLEFDWYKRDNFDLLGYVQTMGVGGVTTKFANDATMESTGVEFTLSTVNVKLPVFTWGTDLIFGWTENKITKLDSYSQVIDLVDGRGWGRLQGYPINCLFSIPFAGLTEEGLPTFHGNNNTLIGPSNYSDIYFQEYSKEQLEYLKYEGSLDPKINGSFGNTFGFFNNSLKLEVFFTYQFGGVLRLDPLCTVNGNNYSDLAASMKEMKNRWVVPGDEKVTTIPVIASTRQLSTIQNLAEGYSAYNYSDQRVAKSDFIRLQSLSLSYDLPSKYFEGQKAVSSFMVKLSAQNIWLAYADKKLNGRDPEYYNTGGVSSPTPRQLTLTLRLGL